ncbi:TerD family protein [Nocardioides sp. NPDC057577]|uniref:TerD family protein n=1 Tax=Nocardioides sp. NPDC057577 TaxID=3346171 RepID=UPI0036700D16
MLKGVREVLIRSTWTVPRAPETSAGRPDGEVLARQVDVALMAAGFKASPEVLAHLAEVEESVGREMAEEIVAITAAAVGARAKHNIYFRDFPRNVPDTVDFWVGLLTEALATVTSEEEIDRLFPTKGGLNLLALPRYGRYQHTYTEMVAAHGAFVPALSDRRTVLRLGAPVEEAAHELYLAWAARTTPPSLEELADLAVLAEFCADMEQPVAVPARERLAVVNAAQVRAGRSPHVTTVTDVLRLAVALSGGDVTLATPTRFVSLPRRLRRLLLGALDAVVAKDSARAADAVREREAWKRLGERLHAGEYPQSSYATEVFATARDPRRMPTLAARVERAVINGELTAAVATLATAPGMLVRAFDRMIRMASTPAEHAAVLDAVESALPKVAGRLVLSLREHVVNRADVGGARVFVNRRGHAHAEQDRRGALDAETIARVRAACDVEYRRRLDLGEQVVIDPSMLGVTLPLSGRVRSDGFGTLPRGSRTRIDGEALRFFVHWRQARERTDLDLSCLLLHADFTFASQVSYTELTGAGMVHSGDIVEAPEGASEMIDIELGRVRADVIVPQVNVYSGESFEQCAEAYFGYMERSPGQEGLPFEPATVRMRSDLTGPGRVSLPVAFVRRAGVWQALWLNLSQPGAPRFNTVEGNAGLTTEQVRAIDARTHLDLGYLAGLLRASETSVTIDSVPLPGSTFISSEMPDDVPEGCRVITPRNLMDLVPA